MTLALTDDGQLASRGISKLSGDLGSWAASADEAARVIVRFVYTPFIPDTLKAWLDPEAAKGPNGDRSPANIDPEATASQALAAVLTGQEVGISPMVALRHIQIIGGVPTMSSLLLRGLLMAAGHDLWIEESTMTRAIVKGKRRNSTHPQTSIWDENRARLLGLLGRKQYREQPGAMYVARATAECARWIAPDVMIGLPYITEEFVDMVDVPGSGPALFEGATTTGGAPSTGPEMRAAQRPATSRAAKKAAAKTAATTAERLDDATAGVPQPHVAAPPGQRRINRMYALLAESGIDTKDRDKNLAYISAALGRKVDSTKDMSAHDVETTIEQLEAEAKERASEAEGNPPAADGAADRAEESGQDEPTT